MKWAQRRKFIYALGTGIFVVAAVVYFTRDILFPNPTCSDGKQNGFEIGIDCGGACALKCASEIQPEKVLWSRALEIAPLTYDLVAFVANRNINSATHNLSYMFTVYDNEGQVLVVATGTTPSQLDGEFPIIIQGVRLAKEPKNVVTTLTAGNYYAVTNTTQSPPTRTTSIRYEEDSISRVYAVITNATRFPISQLPVRVLLYDIDGNAYASGETVIPYLDKEASQTVSFTWRTPFGKQPTKIRIYPIVDPFSGK